VQLEDTKKEITTEKDLCLHSAKFAQNDMHEDFDSFKKRGF
jgi:hypothetical protein